MGVTTRWYWARGGGNVPRGVVNHSLPPLCGGAKEVLRCPNFFKAHGSHRILSGWLRQARKMERRAQAMWSYFA